MKRWLFSLVVVVTAFCGCNSNTSTSKAKDDHKEQPTFTAAVAQLKEHRDNIKTAFDDSKPDECHDALHEIGELIGQLSEIASKTSLAVSDQEQIKAAAEKLMDAFGKIDGKMHGDADGASYNDVASVVDEAIGTLDSKLAQLAGKN